MKFNRISRMFISLLLASGIELSLTTCTKSGTIIDSDAELNTTPIYRANDIEEETNYYHFAK